MLYPQAPSAVVMVRPHHFCSNPETADDNKFQILTSDNNAQKIAQDAYLQVTKAAQALRESGVEVHLFEDEGETTPDSVFPNNWFTTHTGGYVGVFPMYAENRRCERRQDILNFLKVNYRVQEIADYSGLEMDEIYLEGTGSMVLDHLERIAYATESFRTSPVALERFCAHFNYEPMLFEARDSQGCLIYHTNVMMCIGTDYALICSDMIVDVKRRQEVLQRLRQSGKTIIELSESQVQQFCGNALELHGTSGRQLALSQSAYDALTPAQIKTLQDHVALLPIDVSTLEMAGGSLRCMLAGVHLTKR